LLKPKASADSELFQIRETNLAGINIFLYIIYYGPKMTGRHDGVTTASIISESLSMIAG
jgi:hypothetical protein